MGQNRPYLVEENVGTRAICACGRSSQLPYCDGSHMGTRHQPFMVEIEKPGPIAWCGCRKSSRRPYCDGTHERLEDQE